MPRRKPRPKPLATIWEIPDELWGRIEPILEGFWPRKPTGRRVANWRKMLDGIIFRMRSGSQWGQMPERFGPKSTVHDWFQRWVEGGIFEKIWAELVAECDEIDGAKWDWQSADAMLGKARSGGGGKTGRNPTDRGKKGIKKSPVVDGDGGPLGVVIAGANVVERKLLAGTIEAIVVERPDPDEQGRHLRLDKGYDNPNGRAAATAGGDVPPIRRIGEEAKKCDRSAGHKQGAMGGGACVRVVVEVPWHPDPLGQGGRELFGADSDGLRAVVVPAALPVGTMRRKSRYHMRIRAVLDDF